MTKTDGYEEVSSGELVKWTTVGQELEGRLVTYEERSTSQGPGQLYEVENGDGIFPFFAPTILHKQLQRIPADGSSIVKIVYESEGKTNAGNPLKHFKVFKKPATEAALKALGVEDYEEVEDETEE